MYMYMYSRHSVLLEFCSTADKFYIILHIKTDNMASYFVGCAWLQKCELVLWLPVT